MNILWFLTKLIRYMTTREQDIFSWTFKFTQVKSFREAGQLVWKKIVSTSECVLNLSDTVYALPKYFCTPKYMETYPML